MTFLESNVDASGVIEWKKYTAAFINCVCFDRRESQDE